MKTPFLKTVLSILRKDLQVELRGRELVTSMGLFALLSVMIFSFALELDRQARQEVIGGVLWVTVVFASILGLNRGMAMEREGGGMDAMLIAPIERAAIFCGKLVANFLFALIVGLVLLVVMTVLYNITILRPWLLVVLVLGTLGFSTIGTLLAAMTAQTRSRESLLPIVMMPIALPVLLAAVRASAGILNETPMDDWIGWMQILVLVDVVFLAMCLLLFEFVVEE